MRERGIIVIFKYIISELYNLTDMVILYCTHFRQSSCFCTMGCPCSYRSLWSVSAVILKTEIRLLPQASEIIMYCFHKRMSLVSLPCSQAALMQHVRLGTRADDIQYVLVPSTVYITEIYMKPLNANGLMV